MEYVTYSADSGLANIVLNRPERLNAAGAEVRRDLTAALVMFAADPSARVAILSGAGRAFCAGRDMKEEAVTGSGSYGSQSYPQVVNRQFLIDTDKVLICAVHGYSVGYGFYLVLGCDYRIAASSAQFSMPEIATGVLGPFDMGIYENLPWAIATEIALLGRRLSAERLHSVGVLNEVVADGSQFTRAQEVAEEFLRLPANVLMATKRLMMLARPGASPEVHGVADSVRRDLRNNPARVTAAAEFADQG
jgi:enoyl-CoA hydratase/carnithine racemase